jgi:hypothetical protein
MRYLAFRVLLMTLLLLSTPSARAATNLTEYILSRGFHAIYAHLDPRDGPCVDCTRYSDSECCWNGSRCMSPTPAWCATPNQDWWRWQFSAVRNKAYDVLYTDGSAAPLIHYAATYTDCGLGYNVLATGCGRVYRLANSIVLSPVSVDEACGAAPYGDGHPCPSGSGSTPVTYADPYRSCSGVANYMWYVMPGGAPVAGAAAGTNDIYTTGSYDIDRSKPVVHIHWVITNTWTAGACPSGAHYEDWWFGTTVRGDKAPIVTFGGPGVFVHDTGHWSLVIGN